MKSIPHPVAVRRRREITGRQFQQRNRLDLGSRRNTVEDGNQPVAVEAAPVILIGFYLDLGDATNQSTVAIALQLFVIAPLFQLFDGVQVIAAGALRGYRDTAVPMLIAAIGYWAIGFAGGWLLAFPLGFGAIGLWLGLVLGLAVVAIALPQPCFHSPMNGTKPAL